ncbi:Calx-beta domain protein [Rubripirellula tenax]|uniref:Calx-beta domain protein n=2 Tax=Rubripirellula tenax TaxID=2528015 RepID=A0A5C6ES82_9BACT|nr:Calx-beta domain protein [Rubripirellula tenax]
MMAAAIDDAMTSHASVESSVVAGSASNAIAKTASASSAYIGRPISITVGPGTVTEGALGQTATTSVTVSRSGSLSQPVRVLVTVSDGTAKRSDNDFEGYSREFTIPAGRSHIDVPIKVFGDGKYEGHEYLTVRARLNESTFSSPWGSNRVSIINDDAKPFTTVDSLTNNVIVNEGDVGYQTLSFDYKPTSPSSERTVVRVQTRSLARNPTAGVDYEAVDKLLVWQPGETHTQRVEVKVYGDTNYNDSSRETFQVLVTPIQNARVAARNYTNVTIVDDDDAPPPIPTQLTFEHVREAEGNGGARTARATFRLSNPTNYGVEIQYAPKTGGAWGAAVEGEDFQLKAGRVIIPAGQTEVTLDIPIVGDNLVESDEYFHVSLTAPDWVHVPNPHMGVTLLNDDSPLVDAHAAVFRNGTWFIDGGDGGSAERTVSFGLAGDTPLTGDFNGDGSTDLAVVRNNHASGMLDWYFDYSANGTLDATRHFGLLGDKAVAGDFNGDGETDVAVVRENHWTGGLDWYVDYDRAGFAAEDVKRFGNIGDQIVPGDFDGNGRTDFGVARNENGFLRWYMDIAGDGESAEQSSIFGLSTDRALVGDWDGDGDDDFGVARVLKAEVVDLLFDLTDGQDHDEERRIRYGWESDEFLSL